jgi:hypothetical protein
MVTGKRKELADLKTGSAADFLRIQVLCLLPLQGRSILTSIVYKHSVRTAQ